MSHAIGSQGRNCFAICDDNFSEVILNEIKFFGFGLAFLFYGITIKTSINNYKQKKNNPNFVPKLRIPFGFSNLLFLFLVIITFISIAL